METKSTIIALSTPFGLSAIAKVRVSGPETLSIIRKHLSKDSCISHVAFLANYKDNSGKIIDQVIAIYFEAARSYTGEDLIEIDCHGNPLIIRTIIEDLLESECRMAEPGEFTRRSYLNHRMDLSQAEAVLDVIHATNQSALEAAQKQLQGSLSKKIYELNDQLLSLLSEIEAQIDFSEEELPVRGDIAGKLDDSIRQISGIIAQHKYRSRLIHGISIAIIGHPNAGKSSLLNALLDEERALISEIPGTTRDFIRENLVIEGFCIQIIDTAGLRTTDDRVEQLGIERTLQNIQSADLCLLVVDRNNPLPIESKILEKLKTKPCFLVTNKCDLTASESYVPEELEYCQRVEISAKNQVNINQLKKKIAKYIREASLFPQGLTIVINERHKEIFETVSEFLLSAKKVLTNGECLELCARDLQDSLETLGYITGKYDTEEMLDKIFQQFCVGK